MPHLRKEELCSALKSMSEKFDIRSQTYIDIRFKNGGKTNRYLKIMYSSLSI